MMAVCVEMSGSQTRFGVISLKLIINCIHSISPIEYPIFGRIYLQKKHYHHKITIAKLYLGFDRKKNKIIQKKYEQVVREK